MNWVGGARNRLRFSNERKIQKEFFERKKFDTKIGSRNKMITSSRKHSEDLKAIHTISSMHSDTFTFQQPSRPLKMLDLDKFRSTSSILRDNLDLGPSSPIKTPSKLQLLEASHHKQVARTVDRSPYDDDFFYHKPSQNSSRLAYNDDNRQLLQPSQVRSSQTNFKVPDVPRRTQTLSSEAELIVDSRKTWNRKITDEMFQHSSLPKKKHKTTFEPYNQSNRSTSHGDFTKDLFGMNLKQNKHKPLLNPGTVIPAQVIPFVSKSTPINPTGRNMFITEDFQMTPIRKYQIEENPIPKLGLRHLSRNVELSDLSDADRSENVEQKIRSHVFQVEDFMQTPLMNESQSSDLLFQSPLKSNFPNGTHSQSDGTTINKPLSPVRDQDEVKTQATFLTEPHSPLYKFTPRKQLQPVVTIEENHDMPPAHQNTLGISNRMHVLSRSQESSFMTTLNDFRGSTIEQRYKTGHAIMSEMASFPETTSIQDSPKESASLNVWEKQTQKDEEVDEKHTAHGNGTVMTEILDEMQELEKQDKMDEWMMVDEYESPLKEESCTDQIEEEEILFQIEDEEVKHAMNDILTRVVADCSDDFEFDHCNSLTEVLCSKTMVQGPDITVKESHIQFSDKSDINKITTLELAATDNNDDAAESRFCDASTSTVDKETCDKGTQYSPNIYNVPLSLQELLVGSKLHRQFSVKPIQLGLEKGENELSGLESGKGTSDDVETTYCLRSRKKT